MRIFSYDQFQATEAVVDFFVALESVRRRMANEGRAATESEAEAINGRLERMTLMQKHHYDSQLQAVNGICYSLPDLLGERGILATAVSFFLSYPPPYARGYNGDAPPAAWASTMKPPRLVNGILDGHGGPADLMFSPQMLINIWTALLPKSNVGGLLMDSSPLNDGGSDEWVQQGKPVKTSFKAESRASMRATFHGTLMDPSCPLILLVSGADATAYATGGLVADLPPGWTSEDMTAGFRGHIEASRDKIWPFVPPEPDHLLFGLKKNKVWCPIF